MKISKVFMSLGVAGALVLGASACSTNESEGVQHVEEYEDCTKAERDSFDDDCGYYDETGTWFWFPWVVAFVSGTKTVPGSAVDTHWKAPKGAKITKVPTRSVPKEVKPKGNDQRGTKGGGSSGSNGGTRSGNSGFKSGGRSR